MRAWRIDHILSIEETEHDLHQAYAREVRWPLGYRVNLDARLLLVGARRLVCGRHLTEAQLREAAWVLGCRRGAMDSYERFDDSLRQGQPMPLPFAYALPSMPLACVSVCHAIRGITYTLTGGAAAGIRAFEQAVGLVAAGLADTVVTGAWDSPSASAGPQGSACRLLLAVVRADTSGPWKNMRLREAAAPHDDNAVTCLARFLQHKDAAPAQETPHA